MSMIWPGLDFLIKAYVTHRERKTPQFGYPFALHPPPPAFNRGRFDPGMMDQVVALWKQLRGRSTIGGRIRLNAVEIRAAIFAVRVNLGLRRVRRNAARRKNWNPATRERMEVDQRSIDLLRRRSKRTIASLERHMKRANRSLRRYTTAEEYKALVDVWQQHVRWMRLHLAYFKPLPSIGRSKTRHKLNLDILAGMAVSGLRNEGYEPPEKAELRRIMRLFAASARRGRESVYTVPEMLRHQKNFNHKRYLARFIIDRSNLRRLT
jgi:hypothetical protein